MSNTDQAETAELSESQRFALVSLIRFDLMMREREGNPITHEKLGHDAGLKELIPAGNSRKTPGGIVGDFLSKAGKQGSLKLKQYYEEIAQSLDSPPPHIATAIAMIYDPKNVPLPNAIDPPIHPIPRPQKVSNEYALDDVFSKVRYKEPGLRDLFGQNYSGIWDVIRYSAHRLVDETPPDGDPWVVRASLQIGPIDRAQGRMEPWFEINYRPKDERPRKSTGSVMLVNSGLHFALVGREHDVDAPIYVLAEHLKGEQSNYFRGLVVRRHSTGRFFTSRCAFVRSKAKTLQDLENKINVYRESELKAMFQDDITDLGKCLKEAENDTSADKGKAVLLLR